MRLLYAGVCLLGMGLASGVWATDGAVPGVHSEIHGDWRVVCASPEGGDRRCTASQIQTERESGQRALAIELMLGDEGRVQGALALPFGLALPRGVVLALDDAEPAGDALGFSTCLPDGCVVPLRLAADTVAAFKAARTLKVYAVAAADGQRLMFTISLRGLTKALEGLRR